MSTWVLVANRTGARIFDQKGAKLSLLRSIEHLSGGLRDQDIENGRSQRSFDKHAKGRVGDESPQEHSAEHFAKDLADVLRRGRTEHHVDRIVLVAEPRLLGIVRGQLDTPTEKLVVATVPKDLATSDLDTVRSHLDGIPTL